MTRSKLIINPPMTNKQAFVQGFGVALATLIREHDRPTLATYIAADNGLELADFVGIGLEAFDLNPLRRAFKDVPVRNKQVPK